MAQSFEPGEPTAISPYTRFQRVPRFAGFVVEIP